jgi:hypothetical protein
MDQPAMEDRAMIEHRPRVDWSTRCQDLAVVALLAGLSVLLFRDSLGNGLYIGNPDRLNGNLKILKFYVDGLAHGHLDAWSPFEMLGYDSFALPYTFPSIFTVIGYLCGGSRLYVVAGYEVIMLLALAGIAAYAFLRAEIELAFPALVGAILYEFSALSVLKASQNDLSFSVFIFIPVMMLVVKRIDRQTLARSFLVLSLLIFLLLQFTFLQKASYALILTGCYSVYRTITRRNWGVAVVFSASCVIGGIGAFPRIYGVLVALKEYSRSVAGLHFENFEDVYKFQAIFPYQILRWFDNGLFGRFPSESVALDNNINLTEGFLLYTSSLVPFLIIFGLLSYGRRPLELVYCLRNDAGFFFWFMCFTFSVIACPWVLELVWWLYMRMDFTHARILIVGLLPLSLIVGLLLADLAPRKSVTKCHSLARWSYAVLIAIFLVGGIEFTAHMFSANFNLPFIDSKLRILWSSAARIGLSGFAVFGILIIIKSGHLDRWRRSNNSASLSNEGLAHVLYLALGLAIALQTFIGANFQINGPQAHTRLPFLDGDNYYSTIENFHPPRPEAIAALGQRLDNDNYRSALLCNANIAGGICAGHIPEFWRLRVIDGYYGLGVPTRLASLPWSSGVSLRTIGFTDVSHLDWRLLSLLNVKYATKISEALYRNNSAGVGEAWKPADPNNVEIISSPLPVTPRYFFARNVIPVATVAEASARLFDNDRPPVDVTETSFVENGSVKAKYGGGKVLSSKGGGDHIEITVDPSESDRFFVANELYFPGWSALVGGKDALIYPTNAVMRGVVVPAGTTRIEFVYTPVVLRKMSLVFYGSSLVLLVVGVSLFGRKDSEAR